MTMIDTIRDAQTRQIEQIRVAQEQIVEFNERIADTVMGSMPDVRSPFAGYLPTPTEMVTSYFDFMGELHRANAEFALRMTKAWEVEDAAQPAKAETASKPAKAETASKPAKAETDKVEDVQIAKSEKVPAAAKASTATKTTATKRASRSTKSTNGK